MQRKTIETTSFAIALGLVTAAFVWLLLPYFGGVLWAVILALLFRPLYAWLLVKTGERRTLAAGLSLLACVIIIIVPGVIVLQSLLTEMSRLFDRADMIEFELASTIRTVWDRLPALLVKVLSWIGLAGPDAFETKATAFIAQIANTAAGFTVRIGQSTVQFTINLGIMLYTLFFFFRDGASLVTAIRNASPLSERYTEQIFFRFASAIKATVKGNLIIALLQGSLGGVIFWILGIQAAFLWGALMVLLSLLPVIGAAIVWVPVAAYLIIAGETKSGIILFGFGLLVISLIDNLLRPMLVGRDMRLPDYVILISTVGGLSLIGANGFVIGPMIAALFVAVWSMLAENQSLE